MVEQPEVGRWYWIAVQGPGKLVAYEEGSTCRLRQLDGMGYWASPEHLSPIAPETWENYRAEAKARGIALGPATDRVPVDGPMCWLCGGPWEAGEPACRCQLCRGEVCAACAAAGQAGVPRGPRGAILDQVWCAVCLACLEGPGKERHDR